jgi:hypothetical protein
MKEPLQNLNLDQTSLVFVLNFILKNISEDRELALQHHDTLATIIQGAPGNESLTDLEIQLMLKDLSAALNDFLASASKSTDNAIKIAKILSDHLNKMPEEQSITVEDREMLENMIRGDDESENIFDMEGYN